MSEPTLGEDQLMPYEKGTASKASAGGGFDDLASALLGEDTEESNEPDTEAATAEDEGSDEVEIEATDADESAEDGEIPDSDEDPAAPPTYRVRVDGNELEVPLPELLAGYSRQADYTRKTTELATQRKALEQEAATIRSARDQYATQLGALERALVETMPKEPDWEALRKENPGEFAAQFAEHQQKREKLAAVRSEQDKVRRQQEAEFHQGLAAHLQAEAVKLVEAIPEWKDETKAKAEKGKLVEFAGSLGWSPEDLDNVHDHRLVLILRDAMRYRESQTKGKQAVQDKARTAKVLPPGGRPTTTTQTGQRVKTQKARDRLKQTGRVDDAAAAFDYLDEMLG